MNILIPNFWIFWWWVEIDLSLSCNSSKLNLLLSANRRHLSCNRFRSRLQHTQIKEQYLNCDLQKCIHKNFSSWNILGTILERALNFLAAFLQISSMRLLNFHLQSKVIPSNIYERKFVILKFPIFRKFWSCLFNRRWHLLVFNFIWLSKEN